MKYQNVANVGQKIKAYDFQPLDGRPEAFAIGTVIEKKDYSYVVSVEEDTYAPAGVRQEIEVPFQTSFLEFEGRVVLV